MKTRVALIAGGALLAFEAIWLFRQLNRNPSTRESDPQHRMQTAEVDLNDADPGQLSRLGLDAESIERLIENRPYRNKLELLSRIIVTEDVYASIKHKVAVHGATEPVKVA